jgi:phosphoglycolate phosphatase
MACHCHSEAGSRLNVNEFPFRIVGFDLDGTLVDSSGDLAASVNHVLAGLGRPPLAIEQVVRNIGGGGRRMLRLSLADAGVEEDAAFDTHYRQMLAYYADHIADATRPYPGMIEALDTLTRCGVRLAVVTNKVERLAAKLLDALGLAHRFATIIGGDSVAEGKPSPAPLHEMLRRLGGGRAAFVGDSAFDIDAARAAGLPSIAVAFGFADRPVARLGADAVIDDYADLVPTLERLGDFSPAPASRRSG